MRDLSDEAKKRASTPKAVSLVRKIQTEANKLFARECQDHGCDTPGIVGASKDDNDRTYTATPKGKPETWTDEEQQRQAIAKKRATKAIQDKEPYGSRDVRQVAGESATKSKHLVNEKGVDTVCAWLFGASWCQSDDGTESPVLAPIAAEPEFVTRAEQLRRDQAALKASGDPPVDELEEKPFKFFINF